MFITIQGWSPRGAMSAEPLVRVRLVQVCSSHCRVFATPRYPSIAWSSGLFLSCPLSFFPYFILLTYLLSSCFLPLLSYLLFTCAGMNTRASLCMSSSYSLKHTNCSFLFSPDVGSTFVVVTAVLKNLQIIKIQGW